MAEKVLAISINNVQAVALAFLTYYFGVWVKGKVSIFRKLSLPAAVIGGLPFAAIISILTVAGVVKVTFDNSLSTVALLVFFTTVGMMASLKLVKYGGIGLVMFWIVSTAVGFIQNLVGMGIAGSMGIDPHYGILAGAVSLMGGLGTSAAFGPYFEQTYGITGATTVAITAATFGMVMALVLGGPFGEKLISKYKLTTPKMEEKTAVSESTDLSVLDEETHADSNEVIKAAAFVFVAIGLGSILSFYLGKMITLPAYIGAMLMAAFIRNIGDFTGAYKVEGAGLNIVAEVALTVYVTMAINSLKLYELVHLALPLLIILIVQTIIMLLVAWLVYFMFFGRNYEAVMLAVGAIGFGMGATANGLANMQALAQTHGEAPKAWLIVSLVGAFLVDFTNAIIITWMGAW